MHITQENVSNPETFNFLCRQGRFCTGVGLILEDFENQDADTIGKTIRPDYEFKALALEIVDSFESKKWQNNGERS